MTSGPERTLGKGVMNGEDARDVPVASVTTENAETELGTNIRSGPTERTGFEQDGRIEGSTRRLDQEGAEQRKRFQVIRNANRGATERSETALKPKDECKEGGEAEVPSTSSARYKDALKSNTEDASRVRAGRFLAVIGMVGASKVETEALEVENDEESTKGTASTNCYDRLFTDEELDMLERGGDQVVKDEAEEYEKELEERLSPLDDKEVMLRVQRNAEKQEKPTLAEMGAVLGISEEVLERTRDVSSGALGTPEYWLNCSVLASEGEHVSSEGSTEDAVERDFVRNVCIGLDGTAVSNSKSPEEVVGTLPFRWRSIIRIQDYELLKQGLNAKESRLPEDPEGLERVGAEGIPPLREKVEEGSLDEESLSDYFVEVGETLSEAF
ncbi:hypothetical protein PC123_g12821 [Phytophthora cactorum]|nr:hypothetical protein PC120_g8822 [Phytophthora cactorum]KAG4051983.1 hypothetical protein PC123_g12821 [Phytophthora cactorum]